MPAGGIKLPAAYAAGFSLLKWVDKVKILSHMRICMREKNVKISKYTGIFIQIFIRKL